MSLENKLRSISLEESILFICDLHLHCTKISHCSLSWEVVCYRVSSQLCDYVNKWAPLNVSQFSLLCIFPESKWSNVYVGFQIICMDSSFLPIERRAQVVTLSLSACLFCGIFPMEYKTSIWVMAYYMHDNIFLIFMSTMPLSQIIGSNVLVVDA